MTEPDRQGKNRVPLSLRHATRRLLILLDTCLPRDPVSTGFLRVFCLALSIRLLFLMRVIVRHPALWQVSDFSFSEIGNIAVNIFEGRGFSAPFSRGSTPTAWECPLIPYLWAALMWSLGGANGRTREWLILCQSIPSSLSVAFYWLIARYLTTGSRGFPSFGAALAAVVLSFWPESILSLTNLWYFCWQELGVVVLVLLGIRWCDRPNITTGAALGAVAGVVALININPIPIFAVALIIPMLRNGNVCALQAAALSVGIAALIITPWIIRNAMVFGRFYPIRSNAPFELFQGNNPEGCIREQATLLHPASDPHEFELYKSLGESKYVTWSGQRAAAYIRHHPALTAWRAAERFYVAWCTDLFDQWPWSPSDRSWPNRDIVTISLFGLVALTLVIFGLMSRCLFGLPHPELFLSVFVFLPLPHYFTQVDNDYTQLVRSWLALFAVLVLIKQKADTNPVQQTQDSELAHNIQ